MKKLIAATCCIVLLLVGCASPSAPSGSEAAPVASTPATESAASSVSSDAPITLNVTMWDYTALEYHSKLVKAFEAEHPNVTVNVIEAPADDYSDKVAVMLTGDNDVDVVFVRDTASYVSMIEKGQLDAVDDLIAADSIDLAAYGGMVEQYAVSGGIYGLPYRKDMWMLFYNKDLFDAAGLPYPTDNMTLAQYRETAQKLTSGEGNEKVYGALNNKWKQSVSNLAMVAGDYTLMEGSYDFLLPYYETILEMQNTDKTAMDYATIIASNIHYSGPFYNGQVAMMPMGSWFINNMIENLASGATTVNYDVAALPSVNGDLDGKGVGNILPVSVGSKSKNKEMAWEFVKFVTTEPGALVLAESGIMPAYSSDSVLAALMGNTGFPAHGQELLEKTTDITIEFPLGDKWTAISQILDEEHELIMINNNSAADGVQTMNQRVNNEVLQ